MEVKKKPLKNNSQPKRSTGNTKKRRRRRRKLSRFAVVLIITAVFAAAAFAAAACFLKVTSISVSGKSSYSSTQILQASGLKTGSRLLFLNYGRASKSICTSLPYIESAKISLKPLTGINITVKSTTADYAVALSNGYAFINNRLKVLEITNNPQAAVQVPIIKGVPQTKLTAGVQITGKAESAVKLADNIYIALKNSGIDKINSVDVTSSLQISAVYDNRITLLIGTSADLAYKLQSATYVLKNKISNVDKGCLDVSQSSQTQRSYFTPNS